MSQNPKTKHRWAQASAKGNRYTFETNLERTFPKQFQDAQNFAHQAAQGPGYPKRHGGNSDQIVAKIV